MTKICLTWLKGPTSRGSVVMPKEPVNPQKKGCIQPPEMTTHEFRLGFDARLWGRSFDSNPFLFYAYTNVVVAMASQAWDRGFITANNKLANIEDGTRGRKSG